MVVSGWGKYRGDINAWRKGGGTECWAQQVATMSLAAVVSVSAAAGGVDWSSAIT